MTIDGKIEMVREMTNQDGDAYWLVHMMGRKFICYDPDRGKELMESVGVFGRLAYTFFKGANPNTYLVTDWWKDGWK